MLLLPIGIGWYLLIYLHNYTLDPCPIVLFILILFILVV